MSYLSYLGWKFTRCSYLGVTILWIHTLVFHQLYQSIWMKFDAKKWNDCHFGNIDLPLKFNSSPQKSYKKHQKETNLLIIIFQGRTVKLRGCSILGFVFCWVILYALCHGIHHHFSPPFGRILLVHFFQASNRQIQDK